jgi:hypothetical protein
MRDVLCLAAALWLAGCVAPVQPATRVADAARELNLAARFGRMDIAVGRTAPSTRSVFIERHSSWGSDIRIVDVELTGLSMPDPRSASVRVDYAWVRADESTLCNTRVLQLWEDKAGAGWQLVREQRFSGDIGLFGERARKRPPARPDVHYNSRSLGTAEN